MFLALKCSQIWINCVSHEKAVDGLLLQCFLDALEKSIEFTLYKLVKYPFICTIRNMILHFNTGKTEQNITENMSNR